MRMTCVCTETDPDFVQELLALPPGTLPPGDDDLELWVCPFCFENFMLYYDIPFYTACGRRRVLWLEEEWFE